MLITPELETHDLSVEVMLHAAQKLLFAFSNFLDPVAQIEAALAYRWGKPTVGVGAGPGNIQRIRTMPGGIIR